MNSVVLTDQENNLKAQSSFVMTYLDKVYPGDWKTENGQLYKGDKVLNNDTEIVDLISGKTGYYCTLFLNDTRISTTVKTNGNRATGTKASAAVTEKVLKGGQNYIGFATVAGKRTLSFYTPIRDTEGQVIGMFFLGNEQSAITKIVSSTENQLYLISGIALIISILITLLIAFFLSGKIRDALTMIEELANGNLRRRLKNKSHDELGKMARAMNDLADNLQNNVLGTLEKIAQGNMTLSIKSKGDDDQITPVLLKTTQTVRSIADETERIIQSANAGDLSKRIDSSVYEGSWAELSKGINTLMDSVSNPIEEVRNVLAHILVNDFTDRVNSDYSGLFKSMADDANRLCNELLSLQAVFVAISKGDTSMLSKVEARGKLSENDNMTPSIVSTMRTIDNLIKEVETLAEQSVNGNVIKARGDSQKFEGGYRKIVEGFNNSLEAISAPLLDFTHILESMSENDYSRPVAETYLGDYAVFSDRLRSVQNQLISIQNLALKISRGDIGELEVYREIGKRCEQDEFTPAMTRMMESIGSLIEQSTRIAHLASEGNLTERGDADAFEGGYADIMNAINSLLDAVEVPVNEVSEKMLQLSNTGKLDITVSGNYQGKFNDLAESFNYTVKGLRVIITQVSDAITEMAGGNFSIDRMNDLPGDYQTLVLAINTILDSLNELIGNISNTSLEVASGSALVSQGSQSLSQGSTEQASAVEELTATMEQISSHTAQSSAKANSANELAIKVKENASSGSRNMEQMLQSITAIGLASKDISRIIKVIDDIAFQTNILALNAAVEAARAGQYGKGFAVVAEEVRNLAAKSAEAAKDTTALIEGAIIKVNGGTEIANKTARALGGIVEGIEKMAAFVDEISAASKEQEDGIKQIDTGLAQVSQVIQTISATSEESAAASEELAGQADMLKEQVSRFRLRGIGENAMQLLK